MSPSDPRYASKYARATPHCTHWGAFRAVARDGRLLEVLPFAGDPAPSPILQSLPEALDSAVRVRAPAVRRGWLEHRARRGRGAEPFVEVGWDEALDLVSGELARVRERFGNAAIFGGSYGWSSAGRFHHAKTQLQRFLCCIGGFTDQVHTYSIAAGLALLPHVVGSHRACRGPLTGWDSIAEHTELLVCFGGLPEGNRQVEAGGLGEHATGGWLRHAAARGLRLVNVSPARDDVPPDLGAEWLPIRPGTDTALMLGLAHTLVAEGRQDVEFLERCTVGFPVFRRYLLGLDDGVAKGPDWAAGITGVPAERIVDLARRMSGARTLLSTSWSLQRAERGEQPFWMTVTLAAMLGQIGLPGCGFGLGYGSMGGLGIPRRDVPAVSFSAGRNPVQTPIPVARIADMLLHPGEPYDFNGEHRRYPDIRLVYWCGGNPFHHHQDLNRLLRAWERPDTVVVHEPWWTATARHADIVLPATTTLERSDIGSSSRDRYLFAMHRVVPPRGEARDDFAIFTALAQRLGVEEAFTEGRDEAGWLRHLYTIARQRAAELDVEFPDFDAFWAAGHLEIPAPREPTVLFEDFRRDPEAFPLETPSGKIEIFSRHIAAFGYDDCPGHPVWLAPEEWLGGPSAATYPLHLLSHQPSTRLHSQMDDAGVSRAAKVQGREPVQIHPDDARRRGIADGDVVRIFNARGAVLAGARLNPDLLPGVVKLATGAWYDPVEPGKPGSLDKHGNPNVLTRDVGTSRLGQGPSAHSALVEIERFEGDPPAVGVFEPPPLIRRSAGGSGGPV